MKFLLSLSAQATENAIHPLLLIVVFLVATILGYKIINRVPSLLHTPLMSGMNAFSGVTLLACLSATALGHSVLAKILGILAIVLATVNVVGGFGVTDRMLKMFHHGKKEEK